MVRTVNTAEQILAKARCLRAAHSLRPRTSRLVNAMIREPSAAAAEGLAPGGDEHVIALLHTVPEVVLITGGMTE